VGKIIEIPKFPARRELPKWEPKFAKERAARDKKKKEMRMRAFRDKGTPRTGTGWSTAVDSCEIPETRTEEWQELEFVGKVTVRCAWADRHALIMDIRENGNWPDKFNCIFQSASIKPFMEAVPTDSTNEMYEWNTAEVSLTYSTNMEEARYTETIEPNVEFRISNYGDFHWGSSASNRVNLDQKEAPGVQIRGTAYTVQVFNDPLFEAYGYSIEAGTVNVDNVTLTRLGAYTPGQMLLLPAPITIKRWQVDDATPESSRPIVYDYTLKYAIKENTGGWNAYYRVKTDSYEPMYRNIDNSEYDPYLTSAIENFLPAELHS
jgi:hypothetical protein